MVAGMQLHRLYIQTRSRGPDGRCRFGLTDLGLHPVQLRLDVLHLGDTTGAFLTQAVLAPP